MNKNHSIKSLQIFLWLAFASVALPVPSQAQQAVFECRETASDPDLDGYGWEWNAQDGGMSSCTVTADSRPAPQIVNRETGESVQLVRPYWNANRDIAGRDIECVGHYFDETVGRYEPVAQYTSNLHHQPLPHAPPYMASVEFDNYPYHVWPDQTIEKIWTVIDGQYIGPMTGAWVELLEATSTRQAGIRVWATDPAYRDCYDVSGASLAPTGYIGEVLPSAPVENQSLIVQGPPAPVYSEPPVNLVTAEPVQLSDVYWDIYANFWQRQISCLGFEWDGNKYLAHLHTRLLLRFYAVSTGEQSGFVGFNKGLGDSAGNSGWTVVDGRLESDLTLFDRMEIVADGEGSVRSWLNSESYVQCYDDGAVVGPYVNSLDKRGLVPYTSANVPTESGTDDTATDNTTDNTGNDSNGNDGVNDPTGGNPDGSGAAPAASGGGAGTMSLPFSLALLFVAMIPAARRFCSA